MAAFEILNIIIGILMKKWLFRKFQENQLKIDGVIAKNHAILVDHF